MDRIVLATNPGSASRKYALFQGENCLATLHFEYVNDQAHCEISIAGGEKKPVELQITDIAEAASECERILREQGVLGDDQQIDAVAARLVAPSRDFQKDQLITDEIIVKLEKNQSKAPLHTGVNLAEIKYFKQVYPDLPVIAVSDSSFHATKPMKAFRYAISADLQDKLDIGRFGYHGISVSSIVEIMKREGILPEKLIVCHLGGGASITAVQNGESIDNSMGYSPLEGLMMATRSGDIDVSVALMVKEELGLSDDELEQYLNKQAGFLGLSELSDDMRLVLEAEQKGDEKAKVANQTYIYRLAKTLGGLVTGMNGVDAIVFTATVGERGADVRENICQYLAYLGFELDLDKNNNVAKVDNVVNIATENSKPLYMIRTDEQTEMARRANVVLAA